MAQQDLHLAATAGWRALLTHAQFSAGVQLTRAVEEHLVSLLFRHVGAGVSELDGSLPDRIDAIMSAEVSEPTAVGDQCLLVAGLFPEHVIRRGLPLSCFVELGRNALREYGARHDSALHAALAAEFVHAMDVLQTIRAMHNGEPCIDGLNAFALWQELGSSHAWQVLRTLTAALPAACDGGQRLH